MSGEPYWWQRLIPRYGCWGGPGWSMNEWNPARTDWRFPAVDAMDECFKRHDYAYQKSLNLDEADARLVANLRKLKVSGLYARLYRVGAILVFSLWPHVRFFDGKVVNMKKLLWLFVFVVAVLAVPAALAFGVEVPGIAPLDFPAPGTLVIEPAKEAGSIWLILAGQGIWGAILYGILRVIWKIGKPYLDSWAEARRLDRLNLAVQSGVAATQAIYVDGMKAANADGKLTEDEATAVFARCKEYVIDFMRSEGVDVIKLYGDRVVNWMIEAALSRLKLDNALAKAVAVPLPDLGPPAISG